MRYSIITPTYKRPDKLIRCVGSVLKQDINKYNALNKNIKSSFDFELIIVNDSPTFDYALFDNYLTNLKLNDSNLLSKIKYFVNNENMGVNYSRNLALDYVSKDALSDFTIFLDDDDWLHADALKNINNTLEQENSKLENINKVNWLVTNLAVNDLSLTKNKTNKNIINYFWDYLMLKRFSGDVTHVIKSEIATRFRFSTKIKNGEEWLYFIKIPYKFLYKNINTKLSDGYNIDGVTKLEKNNYTKNTKTLWQDIDNFKSIKVLMILIIRIIKIKINNLNKR